MTIVKFKPHPRLVSRSGIQKGHIVWSWHKESEQWLRGKVISINKYYGSYMHLRGLWVKNRKTQKPYFVPIWQKAYLASEPKPDFKGYADWGEATAYWDTIKDLHYSYGSKHENAKLLNRMGFVENR